MRILIPVAAISVLALAGCQPDKTPAPAASASPSASATSPTAEEMGQDDPNVKFTPAPVGPPKAYVAVSKTAMGITGDLTMTPTPQRSENLPSGMNFAFAKGFAITTTLDPGGAMMGGGDKPYDFKASGAFPTLTDPEKIEFYDVDEETPLPGKTGTLCPKVNFIATLEDKDGLHIAAFVSDDWPPSKPANALCATFLYAPAK